MLVVVLLPGLRGEVDQHRIRIIKKYMNEIVCCYNVKLYIKHDIEMVHIIVDKHMNTIKNYSTIAILLSNIEKEKIGSVLYHVGYGTRFPCKP